MKLTNILIVALFLMFAGTAFASVDADSTKHKGHNMHSTKDDTSKMKGHGMHHMKMNSTKMKGQNSSMKAAKIWNSYCPVRGGEVDPETPTLQYKGKTVGFCCPGCDTKFMKDPEKYHKNISEDGKKFIGKK